MKNSHQELSGDLIKSILNTNTYLEAPEQTIKSNPKISARELHKYVIGLVGVFALILITYPMAISRVAQHGKFAAEQSHLKSLSLEYQPLESKQMN